MTLIALQKLFARVVGRKQTFDKRHVYAIILLFTAVTSLCFIRFLAS